MATVTIQPGNSDNKLTQGEWANFVASLNLAITDNVVAVHFKGGSDWDAPWQNACWVCEVSDEQVEPLYSAIKRCRRIYRQSSVAVTIGRTEFV